jgi:hypothetical protein
LSLIINSLSLLANIIHKLYQKGVVELNRVPNRVDYYLKDKRLLSANVKNWEQYVAALRASNTVTIYKQEYMVDKINLVHDPTTIVLKINIEPLKIYV